MIRWTEDLHQKSLFTSFVYYWRFLSCFYFASRPSSTPIVVNDLEKPFSFSKENNTFSVTKRMLSSVQLNRLKRQQQNRPSFPIESKICWLQSSAVILNPSSINSKTFQFITKICIGINYSLNGFRNLVTFFNIGGMTQIVACFPKKKFNPIQYLFAESCPSENFSAQRILSLFLIADGMALTLSFLRAWNHIHFMQCGTYTDTGAGL